MHAPAPPPRKKPIGPLWIVAIVGGALCCVGLPIVAAIVFPVIAQSRLAAKRAEARQQIQSQANSIYIYASDFDERLPAAERWEDDLEPYVFKDYRGGALAQEGAGIAFNQRLSLADTLEIENINSVVMLFWADRQERNLHGGEEILLKGEDGRAIISMADTMTGIFEDEAMAYTFTPDFSAD